MPKHLRSCSYTIKSPVSAFLGHEARPIDEKSASFPVLVPFVLKPSSILLACCKSILQDMESIFKQPFPISKLLCQGISVWVPNRLRFGAPTSSALFIQLSLQLFDLSQEW